MSSHLMIDFETLDTKASSVVLSLGLVLFNKELVVSQAYFEFDIKSQIETGRTMSADTIMWWLNQTSGRKFIPPNEHFKITLQKLQLWLKQCHASFKIEKCWANDPDFDCAILESLLENDVPYKYYQKRSMRTFVEYVGKGVKIPRTEGQQHNALVDALDQAKYVMERL